MKQIDKIRLAASKGKETIARADDVFEAYIDPDFEEWETDKKGAEAEEQDIAVCEMTKDGTFAQIFSDPERMAMTQGQIVQFCRNHKDMLRKDGCATLFLFKSGADFFVAYVRFDVRERLGAFAYRFSVGDVWSAERRCRFVIPQLALDSVSPDPLIPGPSDALPEILTVNGTAYRKI